MGCWHTRLRHWSENFGKKMKNEIDPGLIYFVVDALKTPHIAVLVGMLGVAIVFAFVMAKK